MKKTIKLLSFLFLLGGFSNLACSQNVRTLAIKNVVTKQIHNTKAFEQFKKLVDENNRLFENNMNPTVSEIKDEQGNYINAHFIIFFKPPENGNINKAYIEVSSPNQEDCKSVLSNYDKLKIEIYNKATGSLVKKTTLDKNEYKDEGVASFTHKLDLNNCELEKGNAYSVKIFNSNDKLLGSTDFYFQCWMTSCITNENGEFLNDEVQILFHSSITGKPFGVAKIEIYEKDNGDRSIFKSGSEEFTIDLYDSNGNYVSTKKAIKHKAEDFAHYLDIRIDDNEMPSIGSRDAFFAEIFDNKGIFLGSIQHIDLYKKYTFDIDNRFSPDVTPYFIDNSGAPVNCWLRTFNENFLKQDDSLESSLYLNVDRETFVQNLQYINSNENRTFYAYLISIAEDKNNGFANCSGPLFFKFERDDVGPLILQSEPAISFDRCGLVAHKIKLTEKFFQFFGGLELKNLQNIKIHVYSDKRMTNEIKTMFINTKLR